MFPTTVWDVVRAAGAQAPEALQQLALEYRAPVLAFIRARGVEAGLAEDLCQDVFVRLLAGGVLAKADSAKGRFRSLLCTVTVRVIQDWSRRRRELITLQGEPQAPESDFDRVWALHLTERALLRLRRENERYYLVLRRHLGGERTERNKLWIARRKLVTMIRREIALTCRSSAETAAEIAHLSRYLRPAYKK